MIDGMEKDRFDDLDPVYLLQRNHQGYVCGCVRLLPTTGPTMLRDTVPELLHGRPMPCDVRIWETSRFALDAPATSSVGAGGTALFTYELFAGVVEFGLANNLTHIGTVAAMTFATDQPHARLATCLRCNGATLLFATAHVQNQRRWKLEPIRLIEDVALTPREYECLKWAAEGKSQTDICQVTGIPLRIVARDIEIIRAKLGGRSTSQAVAIYTAYEATNRRREALNTTVQSYW